MNNNKENETAAKIVEISGVNTRKCMKCGKCSATCPAYGEMEYHPHQFVYMVEHGETDKLFASESVWKCLTCFACVERCPRGVAPAAVIEAVRQEVIRMQGENRVHAEEIPQMIDETVPQQMLVSMFRKFNK